MNKNRICHRHIKLENIIIDDNMNIKLIDFGFATKCFASKKLNEYCGTSIYMSPELENHKDYYGKKIDIFAAGVVLFALV